MINSKIVADSIFNDNRITTWVIQIPKFINAEFNTHRMFSRNFASSRAIPTKIFTDRLLNNPVIPVEWGLNRRGMYATDTIADTDTANEIWLNARNDAIKYADELRALGVHKQIVNRILEPWLYQVGIITATELDNFFKLRCGVDAQPEIRILALSMREQYHNNQPTETDTHCPLADDFRTSVARCARVSYATNTRLTDTSNDLKLFERLQASGHLSPFEHQAKAKVGWHANFYGWESYRHAQ